MPPHRHRHAATVSLPFLCTSSIQENRVAGSKLRPNHFRECEGRFQVPEATEGLELQTCTSGPITASQCLKLPPFASAKSIQPAYNGNLRYLAIPKNAKSISALFESAWAHPGICETVSMDVAERMTKDWQHPELLARCLSEAHQARSTVSPHGCRCERRRSGPPSSRGNSVAWGRRHGDQRRNSDRTSTPAGRWLLRSHLRTDS